jgi:hypothetical protein
MVQVNQVESSSCDAIIAEFNSFLDTVVNMQSEAFTNFNPSADRLDTFLIGKMDAAEYSTLWATSKKVLVLAHGQAAVERGFSTNLQCLDNNLGGLSLCGRRMICEFLLSMVD